MSTLRMLVGFCLGCPCPRGGIGSRLPSACSIPLPATRNPCIGIHNGCWEGCVCWECMCRVCVCCMWCVCVWVVCVYGSGVCVIGVYVYLCVCSLSRLFSLPRDTKMGVSPADTLTPLCRRASRWHPLIVSALLMRSSIAPPLRGAVDLWPRCPLKPLDLIVSRGVVACVCVTVGVCRMWCLYV